MIQIPLTRGYVATIDDVDADLAEFKWCAYFGNRNSRFCGGKRQINGERFVLHRVIAERMFGDVTNKIVDHIDMDPANNRRSNLRLVNPQESSHNRGRHSNNTSGFIGVCLDRKRWWKANAKDAEGKKRHLGCFATALEAALAYDDFVKSRGNFAVLNLNDKLREEAV